MILDYCIKDLKFDFPRDEIYEQARALAVKKCQENYMMLANESLEEYTQMIEDGDINSLDDFDDGYLTDRNGSVEIIPFNQDEYLPNIEAKTNEYLINYYHLPKNTVLDISPEYIRIKNIVSGREVKRIVSLQPGFDEYLNDRIEKEFQFPVKSYAACDPASEKEILSDKTFKNLSKMFSSNDYAAFLRLKVNIMRYSFNNIALIYMQKPDAVNVQGYHSFAADGRLVKTGEKSKIKIWQPNTKTQVLKSETDIDKYLDYKYKNLPAADKNKEKNTLMAKLKNDGKVSVYGKCMGYSAGSVFDISQTEPGIISEKGIDAYVARNYSESERAAAKAELMEKWKTAPIVNGKHRLVLDKDVYDDAANLAKPLNASMANYEVVKTAVVRSMSEDYIPSFKDKSDADNLFEAIRDYAEHMFKDCPQKITGIKTPVPERGAVHSIETLIAASVICQAIGIDCAQKTSFELAEIMRSQLNADDVFERGRSSIFQTGFDRASCLAKSFMADFEKNFEEAKKEMTSKKYIVEWKDCSGCSDAYSFRNYDKACHDALKQINYTEDDYYVSSVTVFEESKPEDILYFVSKSDLNAPVSELLDYKDILSYIVQMTQFAVVRYHDGFGLKDTNPDRLPDTEIEELRFANISDVLKTLEVYVHDYVYRDLNEQALDYTDLNTAAYGAHEWVDFLNKNENEDFKFDNFNSYEVCKTMELVLNEPDAANQLIDLNDIVQFPVYPERITENSPAYEICSYSDSAYSKPEANLVTYDWAKAEEFSREHLMKGGNVEIYEQKTGRIVRLDSDEYIKDFTKKGASAFPVKADYFDSKRDDKNKSENQKGD